MSSAPPGDGLFSGLFAHGAAAHAASDAALLQAMLDFELALMKALVTIDRASPDAVEALAAVADANQLDRAELGHRAGEQGTPVPGMLAALRSKLPEGARAHLHQGATSQDVLDTAMMLVARRALEPLLADLNAAADTCARLADHHRRTLMPGRTLLQHASPLTFGVKAAGWLTALHEAGAELGHVREHVLALQFGGAVGTLAALGARGLEATAALARELHLAAPALPWHTNRSRPARLAGTLASSLGVMGKIAADVILLAQTEVAEVREGGGAQAGEGGGAQAGEGGGLGRGGSSAIPHKQNPVGAVAVVACARQAPGLAASVLAAMPQEHERGAGSWQSEWEPLRGLLRLAGSAAASLAPCLAALRIDAQKMHDDLQLTAGLIMSESVVTALTGALGRGDAQELVAQAAGQAQARGTALSQELRRSGQAREALDEERLARALEPEHYLGAADELIERALDLHVQACVDEAHGLS